jgi:hypothetical protein
MRLYIEAYDGDGNPILGNLDGQAALGHVVRPNQTAAVQHLLSRYRPKYVRVYEWRVVSEDGRRLRSIRNKHHPRAILEDRALPLADTGHVLNPIPRKGLES